MPSVGVVFAVPVGKLHACMTQAWERGDVQKLVALAWIERFEVSRLLSATLFQIALDRRFACRTACPCVAALRTIEMKSDGTAAWVGDI